MKNILVKDHMVLLSEYATVSVEATLAEAIAALEKAQEAFDQTRYRHRAILVYDENGRIVGKISQLDILRALEPKYEELEKTADLSRFGLSPEFMRSTLETHSLWNLPLSNICEKAAGRRVETFMHTPAEGEYIGEEVALDEAIHSMILGGRHSLLVTRGEDIVGILRLTDVFKLICREVSQCRIEPAG